MIRKVAWNEIGKDISAASNIEEALELSELNWNVAQFPVYANGIQLPNVMANMREDTNDYLGTVSNKYKIVQNREAFDFVNDLCGEGLEFVRAGQFHYGRSLWMLGKLPDKKILGEDFGNYICFINSHDGFGGVKVAMIPNRIICSNALNLALSKASRSWSTKHMGDMSSKKLEAMRALGMADDYLTALDEEADKLAHTPFTLGQVEEMIDTVYGVDPLTDTKRKTENILQIKKNMETCLNMSDVVDFKGTAYGAVLAATDMYDHYAPARATANYAENNWGRVMNGHYYVDQMYKYLLANA